MPIRDHRLWRTDCVRWGRSRPTCAMCHVRRRCGLVGTGESVYREYRMLQTGGAAAAETVSDCLQHYRYHPGLWEAWFRLNDRACTPTDTVWSLHCFRRVVAYVPWTVKIMSWCCMPILCIYVQLFAVWCDIFLTCCTFEKNEVMVPFFFSTCHWTCVSQVYELDGSEHDSRWVLQAYINVAQQFVHDHPDFTGVKFIFSTSR